MHLSKRAINSNAKVEVKLHSIQKTQSIELSVEKKDCIHHEPISINIPKIKSLANARNERKVELEGKKNQNTKNGLIFEVQKFQSTEGENNIKNYPDSLRVSICNNGQYINRWHGGDSNGAELGMYKECDENSLWIMKFVPGKQLTVTFQSLHNKRCLNMDTGSKTKIELWWGDEGRGFP